MQAKKVTSCSKKVINKSGPGKNSPGPLLFYRNIFLSHQYLFFMLT